HDRDFLDRTVDTVIAWDGPGQWTVYAGGYSDMVAQRGSGVEARKQTAKPKSTPAKEPKPQSPASAKKKLSFAQSHALKTLPATMEKLQTEIAKLQATMADPDLFARDPKKFEATATRVTDAQAELHAAEEQWLELELLREEIGG
ncbi:MAG: ABC transporter ATP-binding protein, partial [Rhodobacteraceae bacterium]|nr:ABC transporter ATP-binding protein [Paracoccaceae bacterium]